MAHLIKALSRIGVLSTLLWVAACSSPAPTSTPTTDLNPIRTDVASTVWAQVTQAIRLTPSITPMPSPTVTNLPTSTPSKPTSPPAGTTGTPSTGTPGPTPTGGVNQAQFVSQSVADGTILKPGETFSMTWTMKNVGTTTWTTKYLFRFYGGDAFGAPKEIPLGQDVPPGGTIDLTLKMTAPSVPGSYVSDWVLSTENRSNFKEPVFLKVTIAAPVTPTRSPTPAHTSTPTTTATP